MARKRLTLDAQPKLLTTSAELAALATAANDGLVVRFLADAANGVIWTLRYRHTSASAYKWEYAGGPPLYAEVVPDESTAATGYAALATPGPSVALPLAGDYMVEHGMKNFGAAGQQTMMSYAIGAIPAADADAVYSNLTTNESAFRRRRKTGLAAVILTAMYRVTGGTGTFGMRHLAATPVRVG